MSLVICSRVATVNEPANNKINVLVLASLIVLSVQGEVVTTAKVHISELQL